MLRILSVLVLTIAIMSVVGCGIDIAPCLYEVGDVIETTAMESALASAINLDIAGCDQNVILRIIGDPVLQYPGDVMSFEVIKVNSEHSYDVTLVN